MIPTLEAHQLVDQFPELAELAVDAIEQIKPYFPGETTKLYRWEQEGETYLFLVVNTKLSSKDARAALDRFHDEWWENNEHRGNGKMFVTVEFSKDCHPAQDSSPSDRDRSEHAAAYRCSTECHRDPQ